MRKKHWIISAVLVVLGLILSATAMFASDFSFDFFGEGTLQTTHEITEDFQNITVHADTTDVTFFPSTDGTCKVVFTETKQQSHTAHIENDTLIIGLTDNRHWYEYLFFSPDLSAEIYLPQSLYSSLVCDIDTGNLVISKGLCFSSATIETDTGHIDWQADTTGRLSLITDTGDILLLGLSAGSLELDSDTGDMQIVNTAVFKEIKIESDTGDVTFDKADAESLYVETDTGDVTGTLLTEKLFRAESDTGRVEIPWDTRGGDCIVITDTGDIKLSIAQ